MTTSALELILSDRALAVGPPQPGRVLGIDLGTTNSAAAVIRIDGIGLNLPNPRCLPIAQPTRISTHNHVLVPSVVAIDAGVEYVGEGAKRLISKSASHGLKQNRDIFWECKNDIGLTRTYHLAPEGYQSAREIGSRILSFIKDAADAAEGALISRTVVTVPASFDAAQRIDTVNAAALAGIELSSGDLLDEPVAAFLDYVLSHPERLQDRLRAKSKLLVFDFGGGTCDVAIFELDPSDAGIDISARAVSRYHRLGGGDIDRAIVYKVLIPQLCEENQLGPHALNYQDKRHFLEPALLAIAEALKLQLCGKITELKAFGRYKGIDLTTVVATQHAPPPIGVADRTFTLSQPRMTAEEFEKVLEPFIDRDMLCARETEYYLTNSIFTPLADALERASLDASAISLVLMVGGSSLIPQIQDAVRDYFSSATLLAHDDAERLQTAVARGAAFHAYTLEVFGKPLFRTVAHDSICVRSSSGVHELVRKGAPLTPSMDDSWHVFDGLVIGTTNFLTETALRLELLTGEEGRLLYRELWHVPPPVNAGAKLRLEYRFNQNQVFEFRMSLADQPKQHFLHEIENPLTHVVNPQSVRLKIEKIEEAIRTRAVAADEIPDKVVELAQSYAELGQHEKAVSFLEKALRMRGRADSHILNLLGIYCGETGDHARQATFYRAAARAGGGWEPLFNLALAQNDRREFAAALATLDELERNRVTGPGLTLRVLVLDGLARPGRDTILLRALENFQPLPQEDDWAIHWHRKAARLKGDNRLEALIDAEIATRNKTDAPEPDGELPDMHMAIVRA